MPTLDELARQGIEAINEKRFEDAITAFTAALDVDDTRPDMNSALGMAYLHRGDVGNAIPHLERAVAMAEPYTAPEVQSMKRDFHMQLATAYQLMDQVDDAMRTLRGVIRRWPAVPEPYLQLGNLLLSTGDLDEGKQVYRDAAGVLDGDEKKAAEVRHISSIAAVMPWFDNRKKPWSRQAASRASSPSPRSAATRSTTGTDIRRPPLQRLWDHRTQDCHRAFCSPAWPGGLATVFSQS